MSKRIVLTVACLAGVVLTLAPTATAATGYTSLGKNQIEALVSAPELAPTNLGSYEKNLFVWTAGPKIGPFVCWSATGDMNILPPASSGTLGYLLKTSNTAVGTTITQYPSQKKATAAGKKLMAYDCPTKAKLAPDLGAATIDIIQSNNSLDAVYVDSAKLPTQGRINTYEFTEAGKTFVQVSVVMQIGKVVIGIGGAANPDQRDELVEWALTAVDAAAVDYQARAGK